MENLRALAKIFSIFLATLCINTSPTQAQTPDRWIISAPPEKKILLRELFAVEDSHSLGVPLFTLKFNQHAFLIFETKTPAQAIKLAHFTQRTGLDLAPDYEIEIVPPAKSAATRPAFHAPGWHVKHLGYSKLPAHNDGRGITVALLDTGADTTHPALKPHLWKDPTTEKSGYNFADSNDNIDDAVGHGTHCAGIIAADPSPSAAGDPEAAPQGIARGAKLMILKIIGKNKDKSGFLSTAAQAIQFAQTHGAQVISNSWRVKKSMSTHAPTPQNLKILEEAIREVGKQGVLIIAGTGNDSINLDTTSDPNYPLGLKGLWNLVGVAATDATDDLASLSNYGPKHTHFAAPGIDIVSTHFNHRWHRLSGTSMATPLVAGLLARGLSAGMKPQEALTNLMESSKMSPDLSEKIQATGSIDPSAYLKNRPPLFK